MNLRGYLAAIDSVLCVHLGLHARYQAALLTADGEILPVDSAPFHNLANAEWWVHQYGPAVLPENQAALGCRWIILDLP